MCGIAGYLNLNRDAASQDIVARMSAAIAHRGPDGEGHFVEGPIALGHRRLSIIDLSTAASQPMVSASGRYVITYNGELYNYESLRTELIAEGYRFSTRSDTEVVLAAYVIWGDRALLRFNGMFAFAVWDREAQRLYLARDRYGIKPLYYGIHAGVLVFGSEQKAMLAHPSVQRRPNMAGVVEYFTFQNIFTDRTLLQDVSLFPPGHFASICVADGARTLQFERYWDFNFEEPDTSGDEREYAEELDRLFSQAVRRQLVGDVELGTYLSGGLDSGSITAVAAAHHPYIKSFTCGFDMSSASGLEVGYDERSRAEAMSYQFKTEHYEMVLKAGDMERVMPKLAWHMEEPRVGQSYPNFFAAKLASKFVKVVLSGVGGDELFGGYPWRYYRAVVNDDFDHYVEKYYRFWQRLIPDEMVSSAFKPIQMQVGHVSTRDIFRNVFHDQVSSLTRPEDYINHSLYFEAKTFLHGLLVIEDKLSMAHGLESRVPFLDNDLVDFAMHLPSRMRLQNLESVVRLNENEPGPKTSRYFQKTRDGKLLFRKAMQARIPQDVSEAPKQGFSGPDASWFRGESLEFVRRRLFGKEARVYEFVDKTTMQKLVQEHLDGKHNHRLLIWSLLSFDAWLEHYLQ